MNKLKMLIASVFTLAVLTTDAQDRSVTLQKDMSYQQALELAAKTKKVLFVDFFTTWCGPCKTMDKEVFTDNAVADYMNATFISLKIDAEKGEGIELAKKFAVKAYPTFIMFTKEGKEISRLTGSMRSDLFIEKLQKSLDANRTADAVIARYEKGERSPALMNDYIYLKLESKKDDEAKSLIDNYFNSLSVKDKVKPENAFLFERYTNNIKDPKAQYLLQNKEAFYKSYGKEKAQAIMQNFLRMELLGHVSGYVFQNNLYNAEAYNALKSQIAAFAFPESLSLDGLIKIVDARVTGDPEKTMNVIEAIYPTLGLRDQTLILLNLYSIGEGKNKEINKRSAQLIRQNLHKLNAGTINMISKVLMNME